MRKTPGTRSNGKKVVHRGRHKDMVARLILQLKEAGANSTRVIKQLAAGESVEIPETVLNGASKSFTETVEALRRYNAGTYGLCEECGEPIPAKRLRALPQARRCAKCQTLLEREEKQAQEETARSSPSYAPALR